MLFFLLACTGSHISSEESAEPTELSTPVWHGEIQPFVANNCAGCHFEGGSSPFPFETFEQVEPLATVMLGSMRSGSMPPWLPNQECNNFQHERTISQSDIDRFSLWIDQGMELGDPSLAESPIPKVQDITPTHSATMPAGFIPETSSNDQYRCFVLDFEWKNETNMNTP